MPKYQNKMKMNLFRSTPWRSSVVNEDFQVLSPTTVVCLDPNQFPHLYKQKPDGSTVMLKHPLTSTDSGYQHPAKILKVIMSGNQHNNKNQSNQLNKTQKKNKLNKVLEEVEQESEDTGHLEGEPSVVVPVDFQTEVREGLKSINEALRGDGKNVIGLDKRVTDVEKDLYGEPGKKEKGLTSRVQTLENKVNKRAAATGSASTSTQNTDVTALQAQVGQLQQCNKALMGVADKLQRKNKTLQNQLYVQKDRQNYLNLHLGGVHEVEGKTPKEEVLSYFHEILELPDVVDVDIIKAYRRSAPCQYSDLIEDEAGNSITLEVQAPGVMFVHLQSEILRELAMQQTQGLGGHYHPTLNHKYFVAPVECEAMKATKSKHKARVHSLVLDNKSKTKKDQFYFEGENFYVNGELQVDKVTPPSFSELSHILHNQADELSDLQLYQSDLPKSKDGNQFNAYLVKTRNIETIRLAYAKVYLDKPHASSVMMAYKLNSSQGSCDDGEYNTGY